MELVTSLRETSPRFREWWSDCPVRDFEPATTTVDHPDVGPVNLGLYQLRPVENPDLLLVSRVPASAEDQKKVTAAIRHSGRVPP